MILSGGAFELRSGQEADGRVMVRWETVSGLVDTLEMSGDLVNWEPSGISFYGFGGECAVHVHTAEIPDQPPPVPPSTLPKVLAKFLWVTTYQDSAWPGGKAVIGIRDGAGTVYHVLVAADFTGAADDILGGFSLRDAGLTQVVGGVSHPVLLTGNISDWRNAEVFQPVVDINTVPLETRQWIHALTARAAAVRTQRAERAAAIANMPVVENPPGPKSFFRVVRSRVDSDFDTLWDDEEWANGTNAFLTDSNYDGITDAQEAGKGGVADSDGDGLVDDEDAVPWNKQLHFRRVPESRYVLVPLGPGSAEFLNDRNEVVITDPARPASGPYAASQGIRIWNGATGTSRPVLLDAGAWTVDGSIRVEDFDDQGRLLLGNVAPHPAYVQVDANTRRYKPASALVVEDAALASASVKVLPFPVLPAQRDLGSALGGSPDGFYMGGVEARALLNDGRVILGGFHSSDTAQGNPQPAYQNGRNSEYGVTSLRGNYWTRNGAGIYAATGSFSDILTTGFPSGYAYSQFQTVTWGSSGGVASPEELPDEHLPEFGLVPTGPDGSTYRKTLHNRSGWVLGQYDPNRADASWSDNYWRVERPLSAPATGYARQEFQPGFPGPNRLLGGPFSAINNMQAAVCGSHPLLFESGTTTSGFLWEDNPATGTGTGSWQRFQFTKPDGTADGNNYALGNSLMNGRGEIIDASKTLWRNGKATPLASLMSIANPQNFTPAGINNHGLIAGNYYPTGVHVQQAAVLLPVEVMQPMVYPDGSFTPTPVSTEAVHLCRWNSPRNLSTGDLTDALEFPAEDPDRIVIRIPLPHKTGQGPLTMHVSTTGAQGTPGGEDGAALYNDPGADVQLLEMPPGSGIFESKPFVIVADRDDDQWDGGRAADGALNDPTFIGWPGGKLKIQVPDLNNAIIEFPIRKFSHSFAVCTVIAGDLTGDVVSATAINENMWRLQEIYAPLHERVDFPVEDAALISQADLQAIVGSDNQMSDSEALAMVAKIDTLGLPAEAIKIVFVGKPVVRVGDIAIVGGENRIAVSGRGDVVLCFLEIIATRPENPPLDTWAKKFSGTTAHECGHSLRGVRHTETGGIFDLLTPDSTPDLPKWHLMAPGTSNNYIEKLFPVRSRKHWYLRDEEIVHKAPGNKYSRKIP